MKESVIRSIARIDNGSIVFLEPKKSELIVPIIVRRAEEESILVGMGNLPSTRPSVHDLFVSLLKKRSFELRRIEIYDYRDDLFYARLILKVKRLRTYELDSRPSDAIAIAVRLNVSIYIHDDVIENTAISTSVMHHESKNVGIISRMYGYDIQIDQLEHDLQQAVKTENYEEAARIRDKIQRLK